MPLPASVNTSDKKTMKATFSFLSVKGFFCLLLLTAMVFLLWRKNLPRNYLSAALVYWHNEKLSRPFQSAGLNVYPHGDGAVKTDAELLRILRRKLSEFPDVGRSFPQRRCISLKRAVDGSCFEHTCSANLSTRPEDRLTEILRTRNDSIGHYLAVMDRAVASVGPRKIIFVTAAASNYYKKLKILVSNLTGGLFSQVKDYAFVIFDIGLTASERTEIQKKCNCQLLQFPFSSLPTFMKQLKCYTWKPMIINALLPKSQFTVWMDTSVRWTPKADVDLIFRRLEERGMLFDVDISGTIAQRTQASMFQHFGDRACQYEPYREVAATYGFFHNEPFVREAVMKPWVACACKWECMCIPNHSTKLPCNHRLPRKLSECHRFDQSALGIIVSKLYQDRRALLRFPGGIAVIR